jgi:hypothetical protein
MLPDLRTILEALVGQQVEFIIIGGMAARSSENHRRLVAALKPFQPVLRAPGETVPFVWDDRTLELGSNFTFSTTAGDLDVFGELAGGATYESILPNSTALDLFEHPVRVMGLRDLIRTKEAPRRAKDATTLEILRETLRLLDEKRAADRDN